MCPKGAKCDACDSPCPSMEIHWKSWSMKLCDRCLPEYINDKIVAFFDLKGEPGENSSVN